MNGEFMFRKSLWFKAFVEQQRLFSYRERILKTENLTKMLIKICSIKPFRSYMEKVTKTGFVETSKTLKTFFVCA